MDVTFSYEPGAKCCVCGDGMLSWIEPFAPDWMRCEECDAEMSANTGEVRK